ncbi:MAG: hypothetical protein M3P87_05415 [Actinomycetota bacterium]|nr:hypothetical protein [Actinomycetota bacterium]
MSIDLRHELHEYGEYVEETQGALTVEQILKRSGAIQFIPDDERDTHHDQTRRRWAAVLAVAAILLTVGVALLIGALRNDVPPVDSVTTAVAPVTETTVVPSADGPLGWTQATPPAGVEQVEEVWAMTDGGYALWTGSEIWTSADGMEWELSASTPDLVDLSPEPRSVIDFGGGWLVVGGDSERDPVVAYSANGTTWETTPLPETRGNPLMIAASRSTAVVIGLPSGSNAAAVVWLSQDGRSWNRAAEIAELDGVPMNPERLVFTGAEFVMQSRNDEGFASFPKMWRSVDGVSWAEGEEWRYSHGMNYDGLGSVEALTALGGEPLVLQRDSMRGFGYIDTFEDSTFSGWPRVLIEVGADREVSVLPDDLSLQPIGGGFGLIVASATELWFTTSGEVWSSQRLEDVFGSDGEMTGAAVSDVSVLVAFSPNAGESFELWLGEPTE